jgi:hypothetical protein
VDVAQLDTPTVCKLYERELDLLHSQRKSDENAGVWETAKEREQFERDCEEWRQALKVKLREALWTDGIVIDRVRWNSAEAIFRVIARDKQATHRDYSVEISVSEALSLAELHDQAPLAAIVADCVARIREARARYLARMQ